MSATVTAAASALVTGLAALAEALRAAAIDPADQVRMMVALADYFPTPPVATAPIGETIATAETITAAVARRCALISLARATSEYQPSSYNDAITLRNMVAELIDAEMLVAADADDDMTYAALKQLRTAVIQDLTTRGAQLPTLATFTTAVPVAALPMAYKLYGDATRADQLIASANPINPAFLPLSFTALNS
jgi:prophage DNA circulation protein